MPYVTWRVVGKSSRRKKQGGRHKIPRFYPMCRHDLHLFPVCCFICTIGSRGFGPHNSEFQSCLFAVGLQTNSLALLNLVFLFVKCEHTAFTDRCMVRIKTMWTSCLVQRLIHVGPRELPEACSDPVTVCSCFCSPSRSLCRCWPQGPDEGHQIPSDSCLAT